MAGTGQHVEVTIVGDDPVRPRRDGAVGEFAVIHVTRDEPEAEGGGDVQQVVPQRRHGLKQDHELLPAPIADSMPLFGPDGLGLDSIDALELVVSLEKKFGVSVPNSEAARKALATVDSIHDYVVRMKAEG